MFRKENIFYLLKGLKSDKLNGDGQTFEFINLYEFINQESYFFSAKASSNFSLFPRQVDDA